MICEVINGQSPWHSPLEIPEDEIDGYADGFIRPEKNVLISVGMNAGAAILVQPDSSFRSYLGTYGLATCTAMVVVMYDPRAQPKLGARGRLARPLDTEAATPANQYFVTALHTGPGPKEFAEAYNYLGRMYRHIASPAHRMEAHVIAPAASRGDTSAPQNEDEFNRCVNALRKRLPRVTIYGHRYSTSEHRASDAGSVYVEFGPGMTRPRLLVDVANVGAVASIV